MRKYSLAGSILAMLVAFCIVPSAVAGTIIPGDVLTINSYNHLDGAGIISFDVSSGGTYDTFCALEGAPIDVGPGYVVVGFKAVKNPKADFLFQQFAKGVFDNLVRSGDPNLDLKYQQGLQQVLWALLEGDTPSAGTYRDPFIDAAAGITGGGYGSLIMLLEDQRWGRHVPVQDQFYNGLPEPSTLLLLGLGLTALGVSARKRK